MQKFVLQVLSNPVAGREDEYNRWYDEQHLADVLKVPGFLSAQRFTLASSDDTESTWRYLALYEFEAEDAAQAMAALTERAGGPEMPLSEAMDMNVYSVTPWVAITDRQQAKNKSAADPRPAMERETHDSTA